MSIEINFIEKKENKFVLPLIILLVSLILIAIVITIIVVQKNAYSDELKNTEMQMVRLEDELLEWQTKTADQQLLLSIEEEVDNIQAESPPINLLYQEVVQLLQTSDQLLHFQIDGATEALVIGDFSSLTEIAHYVSNLLEKPYIIDTELTDVRLIDKSYEATLTVTMDEATLLNFHQEN